MTYNTALTEEIIAKYKITLCICMAYSLEASRCKNGRLGYIQTVIRGLLAGEAVIKDIAQ